MLIETTQCSPGIVPLRHINSHSPSLALTRLAKVEKMIAEWISSGPSHIGAPDASASERKTESEGFAARRARKGHVFAASQQGPIMLCQSEPLVSQNG